MDGTTVNGELNHKLESRGFDGNDGLESHMASVKRMRWGINNCRDATKIDKTRLATLTKLRRVAKAC
jgi:hypothetical protein